MEHERDAPSGRVEVVLLAVSRRLVARPWTVLAVWVLIVAGALPFALRLPEVLTQQAASKVVPGTSSARATDIVTAEFPQHSERETVVVLSGWDPGTVQMRQALAVLDAAIGRLAGEGQVLQSVSAYTLHRDAVIGFVDAQLAAAPASSSDRPTPADRGSAGLIPAEPARPRRPGSSGPGVTGTGRKRQDRARG